MSSRKERAEILPNANNPRLLMRLVGLVAAGLRRPRALAEVLEVEVRTVHYYTQAATWLGLLHGVHEVQLTRHGLAMAFAEPRQRRRHYAHAVWRTPAARDLLLGRKTMPDAQAIAAWIQERDPELAETTARRRASAIRSLLEPAFGRRPSARTPQGEQLQLPFGRPPSSPELDDGPPPRPPATPVRHVSGDEDNLDVYARLLRRLLDHGELRTGHLRALLDEMDARDVPLGPYAEMAVRRGDATRDGDRLIITEGAVQRREVAGDTVLVALTEPGYRRWLRLARQTPESLTPMQRRERSHYQRQYRSWDLRVFGQAPTPSAVDKALARLLPGRIAEALPRAESAGEALARTQGSFVENLGVRYLPVAFPREITTFAGGVTAANALARRNRSAPAGVRLPDPMETARVFHAGLHPPGGTRQRLVPDTFSLRLRLITACPAMSLTAALLILDRRPDAPVQVRLAGDRPMVWWQGAELGPALAVFSAFGAAQHWVVSRPPHGGLSDSELASTARAVGIASRTGRRLVLDEELFAKLQEDPEARLVYESLLPLEDSLHAWLDRLDTPIPSW